MHLIIFLIQKKVKFTKKNSSIITGGCNSEFKLLSYSDEFDPCTTFLSLYTTNLLLSH